MPKKYLLVDDNENQHELFKCYAMTVVHAEFHYANGIQQAAEKIATEEIDVVLLDNRLHPYEDYRETIPLIREAGFEGKVILISSDVNHPIFRDAEEYTISSCIDKSEFSLSNFSERLAELSS